MGQKVNPHGIRVGVISGWDTQWFADKKNFAVYLKEDNDIRKGIKTKYYSAAISKITIERAANTVTVNIHSGRPGVVIGKDAAGIADVKKLVEKIVKGKVELVVIENKDRLCRFGFELFESFCKYFKTKILVVNDLSEKTYEQELTEDLISIIHYFSMKSYSHRRKLNKLAKELENKNKSNKIEK